MFVKTKLATKIKSALMIGTSATFLLSQHAVAQDDASENVERISVTGSHIGKADLENSAPVVALDADAIAASGAINLGDLLNQLPSLGSTFGLGNSSRFIGTTGLNLLDLRRLGDERTLVLVNGKRHVAGNVGTASVDINTIPTEWIERVEVITGGASAVYGADAVTGVVNFILKDRIEGIKVRVQHGEAGDSGFNSSLFSFSAGSDFAKGRGNAAFNLEYSTQNQLGARERDVFATPTRLVNNPANNDTTDDAGNVINDGIPDQITVPNAGLYQLSKQGIFYVPADGGPVFGALQPYIFNPDGSFRQQNLGTNYGGFECSDCDYIDLVETSLLQPEFDRFSFNTKFNYSLNDDHSLYLDAKYNKTKSVSFGQPSFDFGFGFLSPGGYEIKRDNAYVSDQLGQLMDDNGLSSIFINRFNNDAGLRGEDVERETVRAVVGIQGIINNEWEYDVYANFGRTKVNQINLNNLVTDRFNASIDAVTDPETGEIVCRAAIDADAAAKAQTFAPSDCVPTSIFGFGAVTPEAAAFFNVGSNTVNTINQANFAGIISNPALFELPAGDLGFAAGYEYRKERSESQPDQLAAAGLTFLNALQEEKGEFDVNEIFAEISAPIIADVFLVEELRLDLAARWADYSTIGSDLAWKVGMDWTMSEEVTVRGTVSRAVRAPNIGELFGPQNQNFFSVDDPCSVDEVGNGPNPQLRAANCNALGAPDGFDSITDDATLEGLSGGNPDLKPEESDSVTFGIIYEPGFIEGLNFTVDYWDIQIDDAISSVGAQEILDKCVDNPGGVDNQFCALISRDPQSFEITNILSITQNVASFEASGVDFEVNYSFEALSGEWNAKIIGSKLIKNRFFPFQSEPDQPDDEKGELGQPEWAANFTLSYMTDDWRVNWETRFIDRQLLIEQDVYAVNPDERDLLFAGSTVYHDFKVNYSLMEDVELYLGVDNVFDKVPPANLFANGDGSGLYDGIGRQYYAGFTASF